MSLPIVIYDESKLSTALGYLFDIRLVRPFESLLSIVWKFGKLNAIAGHELAGHMARYPIDPYEGIAGRKEWVDTKRLRRALGLSSAVLRASMIHTFKASPQFRFCGRCLWRNYHCVLHQVTALTHCPLHPSSLLQTRCPHCDEEMAYHFSARVLDTPFCCAHCRKPYATAKLRRGMGRPFALKTIQVMTKLRHRHRAW